MSNKKKKQLIVIGATTASALMLAAGLVITTGPFFKDDNNLNATPPVVSAGEEVYNDPNQVVGGNIFEEGSDEDSGVFNPNLGVEADYGDGVEQPKPWFAVPAEGEANVKVNEMTKKVSAKAQSAYTNIVSKINHDYSKVKESEVTSLDQLSVPQQPTSDEVNNSNLEGSYQEQFDSLKQHTETLQVEKSALESKLEQAESDLQASKQYEEMYLALLGNQNNSPIPVNVEDSNQTPNTSNSGANTNNNNQVTNPNTAVTNPNTVVTNPNTGVTGVANTNGDKYVTSFDEVKHLSADPVVIGTPVQFKHLDTLSDSYVLLTTKNTKISDHFADMLSKYTNQLLVSSIDYKRVEGYENVYVVTPVYLTTKSEISAIQNEAKAFNDRYRKSDVEDYLLALADYVASKAEYSTYGEGVYSPYNIFIGKPAVCQAYTSYAKIFLDDFGLRTGIAVGTANNQAHTWNVVTLDDKDYHFDFTWYDTGRRDRSYLMATERQISVDHQIKQIIKAVY